MVGEESSLDRGDLSSRLNVQWPDVDLRRFDTIATLLDFNVANINNDVRWYPDIGVICQSWPDEFHRNDVLKLISAYPLTRWMCRYGPWCDSDGRNRDFWPAAFRVPDSWFDVRLGRESAVLNNSIPALSATASLAEVFSFHFGTFAPAPLAIAPVDKSLRLGIVSPDRAYRRSLKRLLDEFGHHVVFDDSPISITVQSMASRDCDALFWDCDPWIPLQRERLKRLQSAATPIIGLVGLPLADDKQEMSAVGIKAVVAKLAPAEKLLNVLQSVMATSAVRRS